MPSCTEPFLRIVEQPTKKFRFRYTTEVKDTHGCLLARSSTRSTKIYPMVELVNYDKRAVIRCQLFQHQSSDEHPHALGKDAKEVSKEVPERDIYRVSFSGMMIVQEYYKANIPTFLYKKYKRENPDSHIDEEQLWNDCKKKADDVNLNIVRLRFSAHDINTDQEICDPVFSKPIQNSKSVSTNDLKIFRMSKLGGRPEGEEELFMFVEKVNSDNIDVFFVECDEAGNEVWRGKAEFSTQDVHHQYAIACRTPPYRNQQIISDVKVSVKLFRPSDGSYSEPLEFTYYAVPFAAKVKRKTSNTPCETISNASCLSSGLAPTSKDSTGGDSSSAIDAGVINVPLSTQIDRQGGTVLEPPPQASLGYQDLGDILLNPPMDEEITNFDIEKFLRGNLDTDSGSGKVDAPAPAPRDPLVKSEPEDEDQSAHKRVDAPAPLAPRGPLVKSEPEDEDRSAHKREHTCHGDILLAADSSGVFGDVPETANMFKNFDIFLILLFVCVGFVVAKYVYYTKQ